MLPPNLEYWNRGLQKGHGPLMVSRTYGTYLDYVYYFNRQKNPDKVFVKLQPTAEARQKDLGLREAVCVYSKEYCQWTVFLHDKVLTVNNLMHLDLKNHRYVGKFSSIEEAIEFLQASVRF